MKSLSFFDDYFSSLFGAAGVADFQISISYALIECFLHGLMAGGNKMWIVGRLAFSCTDCIMCILWSHLVDDPNNIVAVLNIVDHVSDS